MFYISSKRGNQWGVMDTDDGVESFCTNNELLRYIAGQRRLTIYGAYVKDMKVYCQVIHPLQRVDSEVLEGLVKAWKKGGSCAVEYNLRDYLAMLPKGSEVRVAYSWTSAVGERLSGSAVLQRITTDDWVFEDGWVNTKFKSGDTLFAVNCLRQSLQRAESFCVRL